MARIAHRNRGTPAPSSVRVGQLVRRYFLTGLATLFPLYVTLLVLTWIFRTADHLLGRSLGSRIPGLGVLVTVLVILVVGVLSVHFFGRVLFETIETWLSRVPLAKSIYPAVKQLTRFLFGGSGQASALRVVLVEYPRLGAYSIAFVTSEQETTVTGARRRVLTLLIPTPPSPLTGPIVFVPEEAVIPLTLSMEDALKLVLSGGIVSSPLRLAASSSSAPSSAA